VTRERRIPVPDNGSSEGSPRSYQPELAAEIDDFYRAATRLAGLDPVITELVRLRCARHHDCRICKAVRYRTARESGVDDEMTSKIDLYEQSDLDERVKVALRYTDAFISRPSGAGPQLAASLLGHFSPAEIVELSLDIMKWSTQKMHVTLGLDVMAGVDIETGAITLFDFDESGNPANFVSAESSTTGT
jgi:hypothetical protein